MEMRVLHQARHIRAGRHYNIVIRSNAKKLSRKKRAMPEARIEKKKKLMGIVQQENQIWAGIVVAMVR